MSGIFGIVHRDCGDVAPDALASLASVMAAWSVDGRTTATAAGAAFGYSALHVTPNAASERQPFVHPQRPELMIVADVWLDERDALCDALGIGRELRAAIGDAELALRAYEKWGTDCARRLYGDFAFAVWDGAARTLFCATDFLAKRPLLYAIDGRQAMFASDVNALLAALPGVRRMNEVFIAAGLQFDVSWAGLRHTFFEGVMKLPPGHTLTVRPHAVQLERYWSPQMVADQPSATSDEYIEQARRLVRRAVDDGLRTDRKFGVHLSGGLDSSSVTVLAGRAARERGESLAAYAWLPPPPAGELPVDYDRILRVSALAGAAVSYVPSQLVDIPAIFRRDPARLPRTMLMFEEHVQRQAQRDGVRVMLSGWGGDEVISFNGRGYFLGVLAQGRILQLHRDLWTLARVRGQGFVGRWKTYAGTLYGRVAIPLWRQFTTSRSLFAESPTEWGARPEFLRRHADATEALRGVQMGDSQIGVRAVQSKLIEYGHLTTRMASWATEGARHGVFYRYPLLDRRVVEFCLGLPARMYLGDGGSRPLYNLVAKPFLPEGFREMSPKYEPSLTSRRRTTAERSEAVASTVEQIAAAKAHPAMRYVDPERLIQRLQRRTSVKPRQDLGAPIGFARSLFLIDMSS